MDMQQLENRCRYSCNISSSNFTLPKNSRRKDDGFILEFVINTRCENLYFNRDGNFWVLYNITEGSSQRRRSTFMVKRAPLIFGNDDEETLDLSIILDALEIPTTEHAKIAAEIREYAAELAFNNDPPALMPILVEIGKWTAFNITGHLFVGLTRDQVDFDMDDPILRQISGSPAAVDAVVESGAVVFRPESDEELQCVICRDEMSVGADAIRMHCQHLFHSECIRKWLTYKHDCPICRFPMPIVLHNGF